MFEKNKEKRALKEERERREKEDFIKKEKEAKQLKEEIDFKMRKNLAAKNPPLLSLSFTFQDPNNNNFLDAGESAVLKIHLTNNSSTPASKVKLKLTKKYGPEKVQFIEELNLGRVEAEKPLETEIPIIADEFLPDGELAMKLEALEEIGYDVDPLLIVLQTRKLAEPKLKIDEIGIGEGGESKKLALGQGVNLKLRINNDGIGEAKNVRIKLYSTDENINIAEPAEVNVGKINPYSSAEANFAFSVTKRYTGASDLPIYADILESRERFSKIKQPLGRYKELLMKDF
jgi:hypothetical protein